MTATNQAISGHAATVASSVYDANETPSDKPPGSGTTNPGSGDNSSMPIDSELPTPKIGLKLYLKIASYQYTKTGKRVPRSLLSKKNKVMSNGEVYTIKGKKYYRIAYNRYVKVANVVTHY